MFRQLGFYGLFCLLFVFTSLHSQPYLSSLKSANDFKRLEGAPLVDKYGGVTSVKLVYDTRDGKIYYTNGQQFVLHYNFCQEVLRYDSDLYTFNQINYSGDKQRSFLLANLNYFESLGWYVLEISAVDLMSLKQIKLLYEAVSRSCFAGQKVRFLLGSLRLQQEKKLIALYVPVIEPFEVYGNLSYQAISKQKAYGRLRFVDESDLSKTQFSDQEILVIKEAPLLLPPVAGIMVEAFQTPLSHLSILGQNRRIPVCANKQAFADVNLKKLNGKWVSYEVTQSGFKIKESTQPGQKKASLANIQLKSDLRVDSLINIERLGKNVSYYAGNKAANFATLFQLSKRAAFKIPESAFVIPFYFSDQHFKRCGVYERIDSLVQFSAGSLPDSILRKKLAKIRKLILATPLDSMLLKKVESRILALGPYRRMRFRSSTNAEDANGFSGAGVYTSETGEHGNPKRPIERAIKEVWASLWSYDAFLERRYFGIDQRAVFMGVLVHRSFPDEIANGVVISKNLYRENYYGFVVNAQLGDEPVVRPKPGQVTDQFICYPPIDGEVNPSMNKVDIIAFSNLNQNRLILSEKEIQLLAKETERIKSYFYRRNPRSKTYADYAIDLEFKLVGDKRQLYIKQVRPYND